MEGVPEVQAPEAEFPVDQGVEVPMVEAPAIQFPISQDPQNVSIDNNESR